MLGIDVYRRSEDLAKQRIPSWRIAQIHNLDHFQTSGFPVRLGSTEELTGLLDTMQENRFDAFMKEMAGLTSEEHELLLLALEDFLRFHRAVLPRRRLVLPLSTMIGQLAVYLKMRRYKPNFRTVLEIGPGCGYVSLFMRRHAPLADYSQIEACESFYLLQNRLNAYLFGHRHRELAGTDLLEGIEESFTVNDTVERSLDVDAEQIFEPPLCSHYPWWHMGRLNRVQSHFDIVTSNANLSEMNGPALADYLTLAQRVMRPDGILLAQCFGFQHNGTYESVLRTAMAKGLVPLFLGLGDVTVNLDGKPCNRHLYLANGVFVRQEHPSLAGLAGSLKLDNPNNVPFLFSDPSPDRRTHSRESIRAEIVRRLSGESGAAPLAVAQMARG